jgi:hypothetical protein
MGRPGSDITDSAVEAQAQAMISQPQRVSCPRREQQEGQHAQASTMGSDQLVINDQLTTRVNGRYPIVGCDLGVCTLTQDPGRERGQMLANCVVTAIWNNGTITVQGVIPLLSQQPEPAVLAVTSETGRFDGEASYSPRTSKS